MIINCTCGWILNDRFISWIITIIPENFQPYKSSYINRRVIGDTYKIVTALLHTAIDDKYRLRYGSIQGESLRDRIGTSTSGCNNQRHVIISCSRVSVLRISKR